MGRLQRISATSLRTGACGIRKAIKGIARKGFWKPEESAGYQVP